MPAGIFTIKKELDSSSIMMIMICNVKTGAAVLGLVTRQPSQATGKLVFRHVGSQYSLTEIWEGAGSEGMEVAVPKSKRELQVARRPSNAGNTFEIALKRSSSY